MACRVVDVARTTYYEHKFHIPSDREIRRLLLIDLVADIHQRSRGTYGMIRISAALKKEHDMIVNKKLVLSIMRELGIHGLPGPKRHKKNLVNSATEEDLVQRNFTADRPDKLWLTDITEHPTREGKVYCCAVLDLFTRRIVGWSIDRRCETALVNDALAMANDSRRPGTSTIIHSDHGSQGEFNRLSQHPMMMEVSSGASTTGSGSSSAQENEVTRASTAATRSGTTVLDRDRQGSGTRGSCSSRRCFPTGGTTSLP